ncbi:hypothetical protein AT54_01114 [Streptococcus equi subsp. zooepidemicus Sz12is]|uniref:hypothetical protein n=1 Tax=Streptococcus equi TaxID=1336 RepID=UPI0005BB6AB8|nr:hypothetical protein [Streptococcus equi]KIS05206.1 hypothetical protein AT54_01114 [Streptococcus equi subsp. zooepidemicus Sz12is]
MKNIRSFIKRNKKITLIGLFFLIIFIGFSATNALKVAHDRAANGAEKEKVTQIDTENAQVIEINEDIALTKKQEELVKNYDTKTKEFIHILSSKPWTTEDGKNVLTFHENYYEETFSNSTEKIPYAISAMDTGTNGSDTDIRTVVFEIDNKSHIVTFTQVKAKNENEKGHATLLSTTLFQQVNTAYNRVEELTPITIEELDTEATSFLGNKDELALKMGEWTATHYPTMTTAVWSKNINLSFDKDNMTSSSAFYLGTSIEDAKAPQALLITVIYDKNDNTYTFKM